MKSAGKARSNGLYRHIRTSKEIIRNLLNYYNKNSFPICLPMHMRYSILDVSAGRESLTTFFSDIAPPCAPRQLLSYKAAGVLFAQTPPLVETLAGAFSLWISAQEVGGSDVQDVTERKEIICFGLACSTLIIADRADGDIKLLRKLQLRQPGGLPCLADDAGRFGMGAGGHKIHLDSKCCRNVYYF